MSLRFLAQFASQEDGHAIHEYRQEEERRFAGKSQELDFSILSLTHLLKILAVLEYSSIKLRGEIRANFGTTGLF